MAKPHRGLKALDQGKQNVIIYLANNNGKNREKHQRQETNENGKE